MYEANKVLKELTARIKDHSVMPTIADLEVMTERMSYDGHIIESQVDELFELVYEARGTCGKCKYYELGVCTVFGMDKKEEGYCDEFKCCSH